MSQIPRDDLVGFLTGIPTQQKPDPYTGTLGSGLMNINRRHGNRLANFGYKMRGEENPETRQARALAAIDLKSPEGLQRLAQAQRATGDLKGSLATTGKLQALQKTQARKEALLKVARAQGNELVEDFIMQAGDTESALTKAQEVLFRQAPTAKPATVLSGEEKLYKNLLKDFSNEDLKQLGLSPESFFLGMGDEGLSESDELRVINRAEEIYTNNPALGRDRALKESLRQYGIEQQNAKQAENSGTSPAPTNQGMQMTGAQINGTKVNKAK